MYNKLHRLTKHPLPNHSLKWLVLNTYNNQYNSSSMISKSACNLLCAIKHLITYL